MSKKNVSTIMLTLLLTGMLTLAFNIQSVKASRTIHIRADGSVDPATSPIQQDGDVYTFTDNINDGIVVERSNIIIDGAEYTLQGYGVGEGFQLLNNNVTIKRANIKNFWVGILFNASSCHHIFGNNITNNGYIGIFLALSSNNTIYNNYVTNNRDGFYLVFSSINQITCNCIRNNEYGIWLYGSSNNAISGNDITANWRGIVLDSSSSNSVFDNYITNNDWGISIGGSDNSVYNNEIANNGGGISLSGSDNSVISNNVANNSLGIELGDSSRNCVSRNSITDNGWGMAFNFSSYDFIYHNNIASKYVQIWTFSSENIWDDGYPSGGNYWSDHVTVDDYCGVNQDEPGSDGIVDEPYIIDWYNRDHYPLAKPFSPVISATVDVAPDTLHLMSKGGWITCYIELPEGYNVGDIDVSTVMLDDTIPVSLLDVPAPHPVPVEIGDHDNDTIPDLMVKFDRAMVSELILSKRTTDGYVTLTITGEVNGTPFEGTDTIRVLMTGGGTRGHK